MNKESKYIHLSELPEYTINAFVDFEDKNFFNHHGFDFSRIISSLFSNIKNQKIISGASTITQQYARTIFLNNKKSIIRKIKEAFYTIKLEYKYTKDEILEGYLNNIYLY
jgi:membrane peptidoglycan carboxypeptidase